MVASETGGGVASTPRKYLTAGDVAREYEVSESDVRRWITTGVTISTPTGRKRVAMAARKVGACWKITPADLEAFIRVTTEASVSPDSLPPAGSVETDAESRKRGAAAKAAVMKRLHGDN
jgi:hypothetical protein